MTEITLICRRPGFRRCGVAHPAEKTYPADHWTDEQLEIFRKDPQFKVVEGAPNKSSTGDGSGSSQSTTAKPEGGELTNAIIAEIKKLDAGVKPGVKLISEALGYDINGKELGAAMQAMKDGK